MGIVLAGGEVQPADPIRRSSAEPHQPSNRCDRHQRQALLATSSIKSRACPSGSGPRGTRKSARLPAAFQRRTLSRQAASGADHVVGVGIVRRAVGRLGEPTPVRAGNEAGAADALQLVAVLRDEQPHGRDGAGEGGGILSSWTRIGVEAGDVFGELLRALVARAGRAQPAVGDARDAAQADVTAPAPDPDRQVRAARLQSDAGRIVEAALEGRGIGGE